MGWVLDLTTSAVRMQLDRERDAATAAQDELAARLAVRASIEMQSMARVCKALNSLACAGQGGGGDPAGAPPNRAPEHLAAVHELQGRGGSTGESLVWLVLPPTHATRSHRDAWPMRCCTRRTRRSASTRRRPRQQQPRDWRALSHPLLLVSRRRRRSREMLRRRHCHHLGYRPRPCPPVLTASLLPQMQPILHLCSRIRRRCTRCAQPPAAPPTWLASRPTARCWRQAGRTGR